MLGRLGLVFFATAVFRILKRVPLSDRSSGRGQHVHPVSELSSGGVAAEQHLKADQAMGHSQPNQFNKSLILSKQHYYRGSHLKRLDCWPDFRVNYFYASSQPQLHFHVVA